MRTGLSQDTLVDQQHSFAERCQALGLPTWHCDMNGQLVDEPGIGGPTGRWLRSAQLRGRVEEAAVTWAKQDQPQAIELFPACWLIPFVFSQGAQRLGMTMTLLMAAETIGHEEFASTCASVRVQADQIIQALRPHTPGALGPEQIEQVLRWSHQDLEAAALAEQTLNEFASHLAQAYEETNLLYGLGRSMTWISEPRPFLQRICHQVHENTPFGWIALRFAQHNQVVPDLSGWLNVAGQLSCSTVVFDKFAGRLLDNCDLERWQGLLPANLDGLPALVGSEVVACPIKHDRRMVGVMLAGNKAIETGQVSSVETKFLNATADFLGVYHENTARYIEQRTLFLGTLQALTASIDAKDRYTRGHSERVGLLASQLAQAGGMSADTAEQYRISGLVHDVGKIGIPEAVLRKKGQLTPQEFEQIKRHPVIGYEILKDIPPMAEILPGVLYHHERWDGSGYPEGLAGEDIPLIGRVLNVADSFDAMSSTRSYRPALNRITVLNEFERCGGTHFDPAIIALLDGIDLSAYDELVAQSSAAFGSQETVSAGTWA